MAYAPPSAPAYMMSLLRKKLASSGALFKGGDAGFWVIWEPGKWSAGGGFDPTQTPSASVNVTPAQDSLSFHLQDRVALKVGRSSACDIVINDATVSREHLVLEPSGEAGWRIKVVTSTGATMVSGVALRQGDVQELVSGTVLRVGDAMLTFVDAAGFQARLLGH